MFSLNGKTLCLTGAAGNAGKIIAHDFSGLGANLILIDHPDKRGDLNQIKLDIKKKYSVDVEVYSSNFESVSSVSNLLDDIKQTYRSIDILINNAAYVASQASDGWACDFLDQTDQKWLESIQVNLNATFSIVRNLTPLLMQSDNSSIINVASIYGFLAPDWRLYSETQMGNPAAYAVAKGGIIQFTKWLSTTLSPKIRVNSISLGGIFRNQDHRFVERYVSKVPLKRMASEKDLSNAALFLASEMAAYITGHNLVVDGGFSAW